MHTASVPDFDQSLMLPIPRSRWAPPDAPVTVDGIALAPKAELHITLIGRRLANELRTTFDTTFLDTAIATAFDACDWTFTRTGRYLLLRKPIPGQAVAHSIIERVELPAMAPFHRHLGRLLGRELPVPPPHVTLYVAGRDRGIGVASDAALRALQLRPVAAAELSG